MKSKKTFLLITIVFFSVLITACTSGAYASTSWHGLTANSETAYLSSGTQVFALDVKTGTEKWRFPEKANPKGYYANPVLTSDDQLLVPSYDNNLYSLNPTTGTQNRSLLKTTNRLIASPLVVNDMIYQPSSDGTLYAIDMNGNPVWSQETGGPLWAQPAASPKCDCIYVASMDHTVYSFDSSTGRLLWQTPELGGALVGTPAVSPEGVLYVGTFGNEMLALDGATGAVLWRYTTDDWVWSGPVFENGNLYFGDLAGYFYALNAADGTLLWRIQPQNSILDKPVIVDDKIYLTTEGDSLFIISLEGDILVRQVVGGLIYSSPFITGETVLVAPTNFDSLLVAMNLEANQKWTFTPAKK